MDDSRLLTRHGTGIWTILVAEGAVGAAVAIYVATKRSLLCVTKAPLDTDVTVFFIRGL
jgi:hypothetical protein